MEAERIVTLSLPANFVGQVLDGLDVLIEQWDTTERFHEMREISEDTCVRECSDAEEAASIARFYREIKSRIDEQYRAQRGQE